MTTLTSLARAEAVRAGRARLACTVRHVHLSGRPLVLIPLALAGEACAPLAAMVGTDPGSPSLLVVAQPRDRSQRFAFMADLAGIVLPYLEGFLALRETVQGRGGEPWSRCADAPQVLLPSPGGLAFTRLLGRSTRFRRTEGEHAVPATVPALGRWLTFLADRRDYPGSALMLAATDLLAMHWSTGQSPVEDLNLAALAGWIDPPDGLTGAQAAAAAEDPLRWPPAGPATDPTFDNEVLAALIRACDQAQARGGDAARRRARAELEQALAGQLRPTWNLMWQAVGLLRRLPPGGHVALRWDQDKTAFTRFADYLAEGGPPQARRDSAVAAARRLEWLERLGETYAIQRAYDDPLVMAEHRLAGEAFAGHVIAAEPDRLDASGRRSKLRPHVTVATLDAVTVEPGVRMTSPARQRQDAVVVSVQHADPGPTLVVLELSGGMGHGRTAPPGSIPAIGDLVTYATFKDEYRMASEFPEPEDTPWTHGGPPVPFQPGTEDAQEAWS
ncbi:MAG TPA: hypothetical protein VF834_14450 [Streptosporangiaceae bacterium]